MCIMIRLSGALVKRIAYSFITISGSVSSYIIFSEAELGVCSDLMLPLLSVTPSPLSSVHVLCSACKSATKRWVELILSTTLYNNNIMALWQNLLRVDHWTATLFVSTLNYRFASSVAFLVSVAMSIYINLGNRSAAHIINVHTTGDWYEV